MIKFFRRIRQKLVTENKFSKYLIYAIGEIVLVVVGILIALQINNNNEAKKNEKNIVENLKILQQELLIDINKSTEVITHSFFKDSLLCRVLNSKVTIEDYKKNSQYSSLIIMNYFLKPHKNGFEQLERKIDVLPKKYKTLFEKLNTIYLDIIPLIELRNQWMRDFVTTTKSNYAKNYEWYIDLSLDKKNDEIINYYINDGIYKNNVARYRELFIGNLLASVIRFRENAIASYNEISNILPSDLALSESKKSFNLKNKDLKKYVGKYTFSPFGNFHIKVFAIKNELYFKYNEQQQSIKLKPLTNSFFYINNDRSVRFNEVENGNFEIWTTINCNIIKGKKVIE